MTFGSFALPQCWLHWHQDYFQVTPWPHSTHWSPPVCSSEGWSSTRAMTPTDPALPFLSIWNFLEMRVNVGKVQIESGFTFHYWDDTMYNGAIPGQQMGWQCSPFRPWGKSEWQQFHDTQQVQGGECPDAKVIIKIGAEWSYWVIGHALINI